MLVVTRRAGDAIHIGGDIMVRVTEVHAGQVQLAITLDGRDGLGPGALAVTRRAGDKIQIVPDIVVYIASIRSSQVRLGVDAPPTVRIARSEQPDVNTARRR